MCENGLLSPARKSGHTRVVVKIRFLLTGIEDMIIVGRMVLVLRIYYGRGCV